MKTKIIVIDEKASEALDYMLEPDSMESRIEIFEQTIDLVIDVANGVLDPDPKKCLRLITDYRDLIKDYKTIKESIKCNDNEGN